MNILLTLLLAAAGQPMCDFGAVCSTSHSSLPATATITITLTLESARLSEVEVNQVDEAVAGIYRMDIHDLEVGTPTHHDDRLSYLVLDDFGILKEQNIRVAFLDQIELELPLTVIALVWPQGMTTDQVLAMYELDLGTRSVQLAGY